MELTEAVSAFATGVLVVTVRDGRDDLGITVTAYMTVSLEPPLVCVAISVDSYLCEVLRRQDRWALTVLSQGQRALAGQFSAEGRPSARLLLAAAPHHRGPRSEALIVEGGLTALECATRQRIEAGDHVLFVAEVESIDYTSEGGDPLIRVRSRYR